VEATDDLADPEWHLLWEIKPVTDAVVQRVEPVSGEIAARFYRVRWLR
jgi:hypothetical protein